MARESRVSDEDWRAVRLRWENGEVSVKQIADSIEVSKSLVMKRKAAERWQLRIGVPPVPVGGAAQANSKVTEIAGVSGRQAPPVPGHHSDTHASHAESGSVVSGVFVASGVTTNVTPAEPVYADELQVPENLDEWEREAWIKAAIVRRQKVINARHLKELQAVRSQLYAAIKQITVKGGAGIALAAERSINGLLKVQAGEMEAELQRVKLEVSEFVGKPLKPTPARIHVHMQPGVRIGAPDVVPAEVINIGEKT